jgi:hypothetical protein
MAGEAIKFNRNTPDEERLSAQKPPFYDRHHAWLVTALTISGAIKIHFARSTKAKCPAEHHSRRLAKVIV